MNERACQVVEVEPDVMLTQRGYRLLTHLGYHYIFEKSSHDRRTEFWRCRRRYICKARLHTKNGIVIKVMNSHSH
ncbi:hypothetical protein GE061_003422 [Apolygus lucorum]|uniref:Uncharacterized protein n=1 Tax=Apolygus lucorum TaxID=248454 RepID=A0A6A4JCQ0_APOLU|nr:hypothetical protein GE061_003422 [Apolygus lucorum]